METLQLRVHDETIPDLPTLVYLPGLHGDWTLIPSFRAALRGRARIAELTYPRTLEWSLADYALAVDEALLAQGLHSGWLLGESFGSQIVWAMLDLARTNTSTRRFEVEGIILAGGFVQHPWPIAVRLAASLIDNAPLGGMHAFLRLYTLYAKFRHRHAPETARSVQEFVARRTHADRRAAAHRLRLIASAQSEPAARSCAVPVFYLAGLVDPLVPFPWIRRWLRRQCPGYRGGRMFWGADHNVLGTAPRPAADQIVQWITDLTTSGQ